jgi:hypothetical protein
MIAKFAVLVLAWWVVGFQWKVCRAAWLDLREGNSPLSREHLPLWAFSAFLWLMLFVAAIDVWM